MNDRSDKTSQRPADIKTISDPPDMGRLRPADDVARELVSVGAVHGMYAMTFGRAGNEIVLDIAASDTLLGEIACRIHRELAAVIRQSQAEAATAALEAAAEALARAANVSLEGKPSDDAFAQGKAKGYDGAAAILRARAKGISDPPDMG